MEDIPLREDECIICFEPLEIADVAVMNCSKRHKYHTKCIGEWKLATLNKRSTCPLCTTENAEVSNIIPSKYGDSLNYLLTSDLHRRKNSRKAWTPIRSPMNNNNDVNTCCPTCNII